MFGKHFLGGSQPHLVFDLVVGSIYPVPPRQICIMMNANEG